MSLTATDWAVIYRRVHPTVYGWRWIARLVPDLPPVRDVGSNAFSFPVSAGFTPFNEQQRTARDRRPYNSAEYLQKRHGLPRELMQNIAVTANLASAAAAP